ncbi:hypothetical protein C8F01DRAFT_4345 [Mycena amicta]|nr:hypothetical protein C8F01DRAFT_4345 [Mycena amicta]
MSTKDAPWRVKTRPCPFYQQGRCVFDQSCNFIHDISVSTPHRLPELLDALRDVLDPEEPQHTISMAQEHGVSPHIPGEGWTLVNDTKDTTPGLLSPVSLDVNLARISTIKNDNSNSFDSGYGSDLSFVSPQPLPSTLKLLSSPFGSPSSRMGPSASGIGIGASRLFSRSPFSPGSVSPPSSASREASPELDSPSTVRRSASTLEPDDDDEDPDDSDAQYATAQWDTSDTRLSDPPSRFSSSTLDDSDEHLQPGSRFSSTTLAPSDDGSDSDSDNPPEDSTAQLAYLLSGEEDTINTLYDVYMSPPESKVPTEEEDIERGRSIRARVFTPPPHEPKPKFNPRQEASTSTPSDRSLSRRNESRARSMFPVSASGPRSVFSVSPDTPPRPLSSMSFRNKVPFSFRSAPPETMSTSPESISRPLSGGKVPFGFRSQSRNSNRDSILPPASASATHTAFATGSPKPYVRKRRISRSVAPPASAPMRDSSSSSLFFGEEPQTVMVKGLRSLRLSKVLTAPPSSFSFADSSGADSPQRKSSSVSHSASPSISAQSSRSAPIRAHTASSSISARSSSSVSFIRCVS